MVTETVNEARPGVLDGIRVLDFSAVISGSYCTRMMADLGAEIFKIEPPEGEILRQTPPFRGQSSALYAQLNSGKQSLSFDLKNPEAINVVKSLVKVVDVVVENFSPGVMQRLGLDYAVLSTLNPKLIMCSVSGFGQSGPDAHRPAYAPVIQALSGFETTYLKYQPGIEKPLNMGPPVGDTVGSLQALSAINAALFYRERSGQGQHIDISMFDALLCTMHKDFQQILNPGDIDRYYGPLHALDGYVLIMVFNQRQFESFTEIVEQPELKSDERFATTKRRLQYYPELTKITEDWTRRHTVAEAIAVFEAGHIPVAPYREMAEVFDDLQLKHRGMITEIADQKEVFVVPNAPFAFSHTEASVKRHVAEIGEHNQRVLSEVLHFSDKEITALGERGVFGKRSVAP